MMMPCIRKRKSQDQQEEEEQQRNWAEIPTAALSVIFKKLGALEVLMSAQAVCRSWRRLSLDPSLHIWHSIDMRRGYDKSAVQRKKLEKLAMIATDRSGGQVEEFHAQDVDNDFLIYIIDRMPKLRCFALILSFSISSPLLVHFLYRCPLLEELHIYQCLLSHEDFRGIAHACPRLRRLWVNSKYASDSDCDSNADSETEYRFIKENESFWKAINAGNARRFLRLKNDPSERDPCSSFKPFVEPALTQAPAPAPVSALKSVLSPGDMLAMEIANTMPQLCELRLIKNLTMTNKGVHAILDKCLQLESLDMRRCFNVRVDDTLQAKLSKIKSVRLSRRSQISLADELACWKSRNTHFAYSHWKSWRTSYNCGILEFQAKDR